MDKKKKFRHNDNFTKPAKKVPLEERTKINKFLKKAREDEYWKLKGVY